MATTSERLTALETWKTDHVTNNAKVTARVSALESTDITLKDKDTSLQAQITALMARVTALEAEPVPIPDPDPIPDPIPDPVPIPDPGFTTIQAAVNKASIGSTINVPAGTYSETITVNKSLKLVAVGKVIVDGGNTRQVGFNITANDVTLDRANTTSSFEVRNHRPPYQHGAIDSQTSASRVTLRGVWSHDNPGTGKGQDLGNHNTIGGGVSFQGGVGHLVEDCIIENNQTAGMHVNGGNAGKNITIRRTTVRNNNSDGYNLRWHSGGIKATQLDGLLIEDCIVTGNRGDGIWGDIDAKNVIVRRNRIDHNDQSGIHCEISDLWTINDNVLWENGWNRTDGWGWGASIQIVESRRVTMTNNLVAWSNRGISILGNVDPNRKGSFPVSSPGNYDGDIPSGNTIISSDGYLLFWGSGVPVNIDSTAKYWSGVAVIPSAGPICVVNLTVAQRDAILDAAGVPKTRS